MAYIVAFGKAVPQRIVTNAEIGALIGKTPEWIEGVSGIRERRWVGDGEGVVELAVRAAGDCLAKAAIEPGGVGFVLVSSSSYPRRFPGPASLVAARLGLGETPALDLPIASAGGLAGMVLASDLAARYGAVLVVASEVMSATILEPRAEPGVAMLFGDGAGACLIHPRKGKAKILQTSLGTDGAFADDLKLDPNSAITMNGRSVILQATRKIPRGIMQVIDKEGIAPQAVSSFVMHQANQNLLDRVADSIHVERQRFYSNISLYGNTSSSSMLIAASEWDAFRAGEYACFAAFGAGFHWGALLARGV